MPAGSLWGFFLWVGASEAISKLEALFGVRIGIGIELFECQAKQELIFFDPDSDPDSDPDPDVHCASSAMRNRLTKSQH